MIVNRRLVWHGQAAALGRLPVVTSSVAVDRHGQTAQSSGLPVPHEARVRCHAILAIGLGEKRNLGRVVRGSSFCHGMRSESK